MREVSFWTYLKKYVPRFLLLLVCTAAAAGFAAVGPFLLGNVTTLIFDGIMSKLNGTGRMDFDAIARILGLLLALYGISALFAAVGGWLASGISAGLTHRLRCTAAEKLHVLPLHCYEEHTAGEMMTYLTEDAQTIGHNVGQGLWQLASAVLTIVGILGMMLFISPVLAGCAVLILPPSWAALGLMARRAGRYADGCRELQAETDGRTEEYFTGRAAVRAFGREKDVADAFRQMGERLYQTAWKADFYSGAMALVMQLFGNVGYVLTALLGGMLAFGGELQVGGIQAFIHYIRNLGYPIQQTAQAAGMLQSARVAWGRLRELLEEAEEGALDTGSREPKAQAEGGEAVGSQGEIRFEQVSFGYGRELVLQDFSAVIAPGQKAAIVGASGVGKTTLVKLLLRFYDVPKGAVYVDGREVQAYSLPELRSRFGVVMQDVWLFRGTIADNIRYGRPEASMEEVRQAACAASADSFISRLPDGYETVIDEETGGLSRGQKQLLTIARAFLTNPEILILDEATSSVDAGTEREIQRAMQTLMKGRTCLIIAHRASTIRGADLVLRVE